MGLIVQKYGGTSVADIERIRNVAQRVITTRDQGHQVVVVLSAMAGVTDGLLDMAHRAAERPDKRELDVLLATGEQTTSALLAMILKSMDYPAQSLLGHQAEVVTDRCFGNARIVDIKTDRIKELLENRNIVVVAGFQGCDPLGNITTLGRGGSDTSAVAIAAALKADVCEIYTDVDGIYMTVCQMVTGRGGWPLTMFLTPDGEPFWGGTYFPKDARYGRPAFVSVLTTVAQVFRDEPDKVRSNADAITEALRPRAQDGGASMAINDETLANAATRFLQAVDPVTGEILKEGN